MVVDDGGLEIGLWVLWQRVLQQRGLRQRGLLLVATGYDGGWVHIHLVGSIHLLGAIVDGLGI